MALVRRSEVVLTPRDEMALEAQLRLRFPSLRLLSSYEWIAPNEPPVPGAISDCGSCASIWNPDVVSDISGSVRGNGRVDGPIVGPVVQWLRCRQDGGVLQAGSWGASSSDEEMIPFIKAIWRILFKFTTNRLVGAGDIRGVVEVGAALPTFRVGPDALDKAISGELTLASSLMRMLPKETVGA